MGKIVSRDAPARIRKPAPSSGRIIHRSSSGRTSAPPHDPIPYPMGQGTPRDKAWCKKCTAWRYFRKIKAGVSPTGIKGRIGNCVKCGTEHFFRPPQRGR